MDEFMALSLLVVELRELFDRRQGVGGDGQTCLYSTLLSRLTPPYPGR